MPRLYGYVLRARVDETATSTISYAGRGRDRLGRSIDCLVNSRAQVALAAATAGPFSCTVGRAARCPADAARTEGSLGRQRRCIRLGPGLASVAAVYRRDWSGSIADDARPRAGRCDHGLAAGRV